MKYIILRALCTFSNGSKANIVYDEEHVTEENSCSNISTFKASLKESLNERMAILGVCVVSIDLTYAERDGRK